MPGESSFVREDDTLSPTIQIGQPSFGILVQKQLEIIQSNSLSEKIKGYFKNDKSVESLMLSLVNSNNVKVIRGIAEEVVTEVKESKEIRVVDKLVNLLGVNSQVSSIIVSGEKTPRLTSEGGVYDIVISQDNFDLLDASDLSVGTMISIFDKNGKIHGAVSLLNGPTTTVLVTNGQMIAHFAFDGDNFIARSSKDEKLDLSIATTKKSGAALGGCFSEWDNLFQKFYLENRGEIPGSHGKALKTRFSGVEGRNGFQYGAVESNLYEIIRYNGFFTDIVTLQEAKILSLFVRAAGGRTIIMTNDGPKHLRGINTKNREDEVVQVYCGNKDILNRLKQYFNTYKSEYKQKEIKISPVSTVSQSAKVYDLGVSLTDFLKAAELNQEQQLMEGIITASEIAPEIMRLYATGGKSTGEMDSGGAEVKEIDEKAELAFGMALKEYVKELHSEDGGLVYTDGKGICLATIDALDGSSRVETNGGGGTIISFRGNDKKIEEQNGEDIVATVIISYGMYTRMFLALKGKGTHEFIYKNGKFYKINDVLLPETGKKEESAGMRIAFGGLRTQWPEGLDELVDKWVTESDANIGYSGAFVTDLVGMIKYIMKGEGRRALFSYPANKLRLRTELQPAAFMLNEAGGESITFSHKDGVAAKGIIPLLDRNLEHEPDAMTQQKAPSVFGDSETIEEVKKALGEKAEKTVTAGSYNPYPAEGFADSPEAPITESYIRDNFGTKNLFSVKQFTQIRGVTKQKAVELLEKFWRENDALHHVKLADGEDMEVGYYYNPMTAAIQLSANTMPEDIPLEVPMRIIVGHSAGDMTLEQLEQKKEQLDTFLAAGFKIIYSFEYKGIDYLKAGQRKYDLGDYVRGVQGADSLKGLQFNYAEYYAVLESVLNANFKKMLSDAVEDMKKESNWDKSIINIANLIGKQYPKHAERIIKSLFEVDYYAGVTELEGYLKGKEKIANLDNFKSQVIDFILNDVEMVKELIIREMSTVHEINSQVRGLFKGIFARRVLAQIKLSFDPAEGTKDVTISDELQMLRKAKMIQELVEVGIPKDTTQEQALEIANLLGVSQLIRAEDSLAEKLQILQELYAAGLAGELEGLNGKLIYDGAANTESVLLPDAVLAARKLRGKNVDNLLKDHSQAGLGLIVDARTAAGVGLESTGPYSGNIPAEFLSELCVETVIIDGTTPAAVMRAQIQNLINEGIRVLIIHEDGLNGTTFNEAGEEVSLGDIIISSVTSHYFFHVTIVTSVDDKDITPIGDLRTAAAAIEAKGKLKRQQLDNEKQPSAFLECAI